MQPQPQATYPPYMAIVLIHRRILHPHTGGKGRPTELGSGALHPVRLGYRRRGSQIQDSLNNPSLSPGGRSLNPCPLLYTLYLKRLIKLTK